MSIELIVSESSVKEFLSDNDYKATEEDINKFFENEHTHKLRFVPLADGLQLQHGDGLMFEKMELI